MNYVFAWRGRFFKHREYVKGHQYVPEQNKMVLYLPDGAIREIKEWTSCECFLGKDWVLATKEKMEKESGQNIKLNLE